MAQTTPLGATTAAGTSTDMVVAPGSTATIGVYTSAAGGITADFQVTINMKVPGGGYQPFAPTLNGEAAILGMYRTVLRVRTPGTYQAVKGTTAQAIGVFLES